MKILLAADHGGWQLKEKIAELLAGGAEVREWEIIDCGATSLDPEDDYPAYVAKLAQKLTEAGADEVKGIVFCRSGVGVTVTANKYLGVWAANCEQPGEARLAVEHNGVNVVAIGADVIHGDVGRAMEIVGAFLSAKVDMSPRHVRRREQIKAIEAENFK
jgi:ribose 5-phosphate isomerase B